MDAARSAFFAYQFLRNPAPEAAPDLDTRTKDWKAEVDRLLALRKAPTERPELHFRFRWGEAARFLVLDLRSQRDAATPQVVSQKQLEAVESWLRESRGGPKQPPRLHVLVSSLPVTSEPTWVDRVLGKVPPRRDDYLECWGSERAKKQRESLLRLIHDHFQQRKDDRLLILSGDVHFAAVLSLSLPDDGNRVFGHEVISSGLAQASYHALLRCRKQGDFCAARVSSRSAGPRFFGPHFAEIFVGKGDNNLAPTVAIRFHPATRNRSDRLVNPVHGVDELSVKAGSEGPLLELTVGPGPITRLRNFNRFMSSDIVPASSVASRRAVVVLITALILLASTGHC
jgi:hypothetical protein